MEATQRLQGIDLHGFLQSLSADTLDRLYAHPAACIAVFRELPALDKHYIMRVLFSEQVVPEKLILSWCKPGQKSSHEQGVERLRRLRIWFLEELAGGHKGLRLSSIFREGLRTALCGGGKAWFKPVPPATDKHTRDIAFLDSYAKERWEIILHFLVGSNVSDVSRKVMDLLQRAGLYACGELGSAASITAAGFQFLLMDTTAQVWYFMLYYFKTIESMGKDVVEILTLLFTISFSCLGKDYPTDGLSPLQMEFLQDMREYGLVYQRKQKSKRYYPTRLAINFSSGLHQSTQVPESEGFLVVETNYRVYAYTDSALHIAIVALFADLQYRLPSMAVGLLTRESVHDALGNGITAEQILQFMKMYSHRQMRKNNPIVPPTISDQVRLWQLERDRLRSSEGVLYNQFASASEFQVIRDYASEIGVLVYSNPAKRCVVVTNAGHKDVRAFWKQQKQK
ncbi:general transcription factor IIH subunit 4-like isoform X2 [Sycon ciliatum]|uniref:general transcription factor IIH subunit 4-like isoform X2 n=1 Tax=Sycon ciliatum TaxID=27933 RepID=UPI0031F62C90